MKIAILGTKGIPNNYGGYEQFAEEISARLKQRGHEVTVYNPHFHIYKGDDLNGVRIIRKYSPEKSVGAGVANIIYDYLCLRDALKRDFDVIYEAGYHSVAPAFKLLNVKHIKHPVIVTNMDGLEWKRSKWNPAVQSIIKRLESMAVALSPYLISDNVGIQEYLQAKYNASSFYLPYGADPVDEYDESLLKEFQIEPERYAMLVARLEPENNIETIIEGYLKSRLSFPLLVVGNHKTTFGNYLTEKFAGERVRFTGGIYRKAVLNSMRKSALVYFHGHSVGGTNPSLLEAMASQAFILAHNNPFNEAILGKAALYFSDKDEVTSQLDQITSLRKSYHEAFIKDNLSKIKLVFNWDTIVDQHEALFVSLLAGK